MSSVPHHRSSSGSLSKRGSKVSPAATMLDDLPAAQLAPPELKDGEYRVRITGEISAINEVDQTFEFGGFLRMVWKVPGVPDGPTDFKELADVCPFEPDDYLLLNGSEVTISETSFETKDGVTEGGFGFNATCAEPFNMRRFPFDRQLLAIPAQMYGKLADDASKLSFSQEKPSWYGLMGNLTSAWRSLEPRLVAVPAKDDYRPRIELRIPIERRPVFYIHNVVFPLAIIAGLVLTAFAMPVEDIGSRLGVVLTLLLTAIAFKYVVASYVPRIAYLTLLDAYILITYLLICLAAAECAIIYVWRDETNIGTADNLFALAYAACWFALNSFMYIGSACGIFFESWESVARSRKAMEKQRADGYRYAPVTALPMEHED